MTYKNSYTGFSRFLSIPHLDETPNNVSMAVDSCYTTDSKIRSKLCKYLVDISDPHGLNECKVTNKYPSFYVSIIMIFIIGKLLLYMLWKIF